jgi:thioredoxin:protein disulfide reductase
MPRLLYRKFLALFMGLLVLAPVAAAAQTRLSTDTAFHLTVAREKDGDLSFAWKILPGHYLYKERIVVTTGDGQRLPVTTGPGEKKEDPTFGTTEVYRTTAAASIAAADLSKAAVLYVSYQGCAEQGICYPPVTKTINLATLSITAGKTTVSPPPLTANPNVAQDGLAAKLSGSLPAMLAAFLGFGLLLALTPCVFPMIPILSGMLAHSGKKLSAWRGLFVSGAYVVAMAMAYAALGVAAAWSGQSLQVLLQTPLALGAMSLVFVALALSMFGLYDLQLPAGWTNRLSGATAGLGGSIGGAAVLGFVSALLVGPCVTPPLAAALLYVAQTGDVARGASALFALGLGMGLPLIVFGTFGSGLLPKSGQWLASVKQFFGFVFLGLAVWMLGRVLPQTASVALWGGLTLSCGIWLGTHGRRNGGANHLILKIAGGAAAALGLLLLLSGIGGPFAPVRGWLPLHLEKTKAPQDSGFTQTIATPDTFDQALNKARAQGNPILIDFTATWCVACQENDATAQKNARIHSRLANVSIIRVDLSTETAESKALMRRFQVVGPPTMLFLNAHTGQEIADTRTVGAISAEQFLHSLDRAGA